MRIQAASECDRLGQWRARGVSFRKKTGSARELIGSTAAGYVIDQSHGKLDEHLMCTTNRARAMTFYLHLSEKPTPTSSNPQYRKKHKLNVPQSRP